jgi:hypothetical protein
VISSRVLFQLRQRPSRKLDYCPNLTRLPQIHSNHSAMSLRLARNLDQGRMAVFGKGNCPVAQGVSNLQMCLLD